MNRTITQLIVAAVLTGMLTGCSGPAQPDTASSVLSPGSDIPGHQPATVNSANPDSAPGLATDQLSTGEIPWWQQPRNTAAPATAAPPRETHSQHFVLGGSVLFEADTPVLTRGAASQLAIVLTAAQAVPGATITVDGFTNKVPGAQPARSLQLSQARADTVKAWFIAHGIKPDAITTRGWGDARPLYPGTTDAQRAANRRCEITVVPHLN